MVVSFAKLNNFRKGPDSRRGQDKTGKVGCEYTVVRWLGGMLEGMQSRQQCLGSEGKSELETST